MTTKDVKFGKNVKISHPELVNLYGCKIGNNCMIGSFVEIQKGVKIGNGVRIQSHSFICEGVTIEDNVFVGHGVMFINDKYPRIKGKWKLEKTLVKKHASIGSNATILPVTIGENAMIGAGSVVTKDVPSKAVVYGNPARKVNKPDEQHFKEYNAYSKQYQGYIKNLIRGKSLNLGSGSFRIGDINLDIFGNADVKHDLNNFPYPFEEDSFDTILMIDILEHLKFPKLTIKECYRILKNNGRLITIIEIPLSGSYYSPIHLFHFRREDLEGLFRPFSIKVIGYRGNSTNISSRIARVIGLFVPNVWVIIGKKIEEM